VDEHSIERIRNANFSISVRGYDRNEVDRFLTEVADWLATGEGEGAAANEAVRLELERVGEQTAAILTEAHVAAQAIREDASRDVRQSLVGANSTADSLRTDANEYAADTRDEADAYARKVRGDADSYGDRVRNEAESEAAETRSDLTKEGERILADATRRKAEIEKVITDLEQRRDAVLAELERLASGLVGTATEHRAPANGEAPSEAEAAEEPAGDTDETTVLARDAD
jgi:DivIVA domain-containing protein